MCRRPASWISTSRALPSAFARRAARSASTSLPGRSASTSGPLATDRRWSPSRHPAARARTRRCPSGPARGWPRCGPSSGPLLAAWSTAGKRLASPRSARARISRACRSGAARPNSADQRVGHLAAGQLAGGAQSEGEQRLVGRLQLLDQQRHAGRSRARIAPRVASRIRCFGHVGLADGVVELARPRSPCPRPATSRRRGCSPRRPPSGPRPARRPAIAPGPWRPPAPPMRPRATAAAEATSASASFSRAIEAVDRLGVAADADRVDHADQQPALQLAHGLAQRVVGGRIGNRLQGDPRPGGKFLVGQQRRQGRHGVLACRRWPVACR